MNMEYTFDDPPISLHEWVCLEIGYLPLVYSHFRMWNCDKPMDGIGYPIFRQTNGSSIKIIFFIERKKYVWRKLRKHILNTRRKRNFRKTNFIKYAECPTLHHYMNPFIPLIPFTTPPTKALNGNKATVVGPWLEHQIIIASIPAELLKIAMPHRDISSNSRSCSIAKCNKSPEGYTHCITIVESPHEFPISMVKYSTSGCIPMEYPHFYSNFRCKIPLNLNFSCFNHHFFTVKSPLPSSACRSHSTSARDKPRLL